MRIALLMLQAFCNVYVSHVAIVYNKMVLDAYLIPENYGVYYEDIDSWRKSLWDKYCIQMP